MKKLLDHHPGWQRDLAAVAAFFAVYLVWFFLLERYAVPKYTIACALDGWIPFCEAFVIPYYAWFLFIPAAFLYLFAASPRVFRQTFACVAVGSMVCLLVYTFLPNMQALRPAVLPDNGFARLVAFTYAFDTPTNVCPSLHVLSSAAAEIGLWRAGLFAKKRGAAVASLVVCVLIVLSTVFLKQHSVVDIFWALVLAAALYPLCFLLPDRLAARKNAAG